MRALILLTLFPLLSIAQTAISDSTATTDYQPNDAQPKNAQKITDRQTMNTLPSHPHPEKTLTLDAAAEKFDQQCVQATGQHAFCSCIKLISVFGLDFVSYVTIATASAADLDTAKQLAPKTLSDSYDAVLLKRDQCTTTD